MAKNIHNFPVCESKQLESLKQWIAMHPHGNEILAVLTDCDE